MSFASRHAHKGPLFTYRLPEGETTYIRLKDLEKGKKYEIKGFYINKSSQFGEAPALIMRDCVVNLPRHLLSDVRDIMASQDDVDAVNAGTAGFVVTEVSNDKGKFLSVEWVDL